MPEAPAATAAPAAAPAAPAAPPAPASIPASVTPAAPASTPPTPKPSAKDRLMSDLRKKAGAITEPAKPEPAKPEPKDGEPPAEPEGAATPQDGDKKKVNPWRLIDDYKKKVGDLESQIATATKDGLTAKEKTELRERLTEFEKRLAEKEDELRFIRFEKSDEFKTKYQKPYDEAWQRAMSELNEITVDDGGGGQRQATAQDMLELVNLPLGKARELANQLFGDFADDAMAHRKDIRSLFENQQKALTEAREKGAEREKRQMEDQMRFHEETTKSVTQIWGEANERAKKDEKFGKFFTPVEGDEEINQRLEKGYKLADQAFRENPMQPGLTPEQRREIVTRHAAIRNRAAAFSSLVLQIQRSEAKIASLTKELEQFKSSTPGAAEGKAPEKVAPARGMAGLMQNLRNRAS